MKAKYVLIVSYFYILLFVYATISKLITFEAFQVQLTQSPLLSAYANIIAYLVLGAELLFALLLCIKTTRLTGLYLSYGLMVAFTLYIYLILNYSDFIPCSCGGILEKMGWNEHLWFNIIVSLLALVALFFEEHKRKRFYLGSIITTIISSVVVILLFISSEHIIKKENNFTRRFVPHPISYIAEYDLGMNSYYLVGVHNDSLIIGNGTAPLFVGILSNKLDTMFQRKVTLEDSRIKYRTSKLALYPPYFYMMDGSMPFVYKGDIESWKATNTTSKAFYSLAIPINSDSLMVRTRSSRTKEDVIGIVSLDKINNIELTDQLLEKQVDGYFDTDGRLIFNHQKQKAVYIYFYRNEYLLINSDLSLDVKGKTIDDTDKVKVEVRDIGSNKKLSNPYSITNKNASTYGNLLLIQSGLRGKNETLNMWNNSSIIDAYDLEKRTYLFSFLIPDRDKYGVIDFHLEKNYLIVFQNTYIRKYKLDPKWFDL